MHSITCQNCHKAVVRKRKGKYCSRQCWYNVNAVRMKGNTMWDHPSPRKSWFKKGHEFLGKQGKESPNWKGGVRGSKTWKRWRLMVLRRDGHVCQECGGAGDIAHHLKNYNDFPELKFVVENGLTLCRRCHPLYHPELVNNLS